MTGRNSIEEVNLRRIALQDILAEFHKNRKNPSNKDLLDALVKAGYKIELSTLIRDLDAINAGNNFVLKLATTNYSAIVEDMFKNLDYVETDAFTIASGTYNTDKTIRKEVPTKEGVVEVEETHETTPNPMPNLAALRLVKDIQECREKLLSGKIADTATALMLKEHQKLKQQVEAMKEELEYYKQNSKIQVKKS